MWRLGIDLAAIRLQTHLNLTGSTVLSLSHMEVFNLKSTLWERICPKLPQYYILSMTVFLLMICMATPVFAVEDMWTAANRIIVDVYNKVAGISTVLAGLMSAVAVIGAKISNNQHKVDQSWDWLKRIWIAWAIINGIGAFLAYIRPLFTGLATLS